MNVSTSVRWKLANCSCPSTMDTNRLDTRLNQGRISLSSNFHSKMVNLIISSIRCAWRGLFSIWNSFSKKFWGCAKDWGWGGADGAGEGGGGGGGGGGVAWIGHNNSVNGIYKYNCWDFFFEYLRTFLPISSNPLLLIISINLPRGWKIWKNVTTKVIGKNWVPPAGYFHRGYRR